ncbi:MAG: hypothetical protein ABEJ26_13665 [Halosimplex sp.]
MRQAIERAQQETSGVRAYLLALYYFMTGNVSLMIILFGVLWIVLGATVVNGNPAIIIGGDGGPVSVMTELPSQYLHWSEVPGFAVVHKVFAGMMGIIGATLVLLGTGIYTFLFANKLYARATTA